MEEIVDLSKNDVTQKPREGQIRRDEVQWTAMSISFKLIHVHASPAVGGSHQSQSTVQPRTWHSR